MEGDIPLPVFARFFGECVGGVHTVVVELSFNAYDKVGPVVLTEVVVAGELTVGDAELVAGVGVPEALGAYAVVSDNAEFVAVGVENDVANFRITEQTHVHQVDGVEEAVAVGADSVAICKIVLIQSGLVIFIVEEGDFAER